MLTNRSIQVNKNRQTAPGLPALSWSCLSPHFCDGAVGFIPHICPVTLSRDITPRSTATIPVQAAARCGCWCRWAMRRKASKKRAPPSFLVVADAHAWIYTRCRLSRVWWGNNITAAFMLTFLEMELSLILTQDVNWSWPCPHVLLQGRTPLNSLFLLDPPRRLAGIYEPAEIKKNVINNSHSLRLDLVLATFNNYAELTQFNIRAYRNFPHQIFSHIKTRTLLSRSS